jgi:hypothetical protein
MAKAKQPSDTQSLDDNLAAGSAAAQAANQVLPKSNKTLTVACKLPHGIVIRDFEERTEYEPVFGQAERRKINVFRSVGPKIRIKGPSVPSTFVRMVEIHGGYAITEGIPADVYERWLNWNKESQFVVNDLIFAHENKARVIDWAKDHDSIKSGMEPLSTSMKLNEDGIQVFKDDRVRTAGADSVVDGKADPKAA